jgi:hypothetical protein
MDPWTPYEAGQTVGGAGSDGGVILQDEEHAAGARITLEEGGFIAPFSITCGIYGWLVHTRFFDVEAEGRLAYDEMKTALTEIVERIVQDYLQGQDVEPMLDDFIGRFP